MTQALPALRSVCFKENVCNEAAFRAVVEGCPQLTSIEVCPTRMACPWDALLSLAPQTLLHLTFEVDLTPEMIDVMTQRCPLLRTLFMAASNRFHCSDELLDRMAARCPYLECVRLSDCVDLKGAGLVALAQTGRLRELHVHTSLRQFSYAMGEAYCTAISTVLQMSPQLRALTTRSTSERMISIIAQAQQLQCLRLDLHLLQLPRPPSSASIAMLATSCTKLRTLSASYAIGNDVLIALGAHCPSLTALAVMFGTYVSDAGITALAHGCTQLREISTLWRAYLSAPVSIVGVRALAMHCPHLRELEVNRSVLQYCGVRRVVTVRKLKITLL
jgi:F-box/leucine-rich repeat protein 2/20